MPISCAIFVLTQAALCDASWVPTFGANRALNSPAVALHVFDDGGGPDLYVGGGFTAQGSQALRGIARWTGAGLEPVGNGLSGGGVADMADYDSGSGVELCAAGGPFNNFGPIARWNGATWRGLGGGVELLSPAYLGEAPFLTAIAAYDAGGGSELYVTGRFDTAGGAPAQGFARWNGANWSAVTPPSNMTLDMLAFDDGTGAQLYCAGNTVARYGPSGWSAPLSGAIEGRRLCVHDWGAGAELYAAGRFGTPTASFEDVGRWNGASWVRLNAPLDYVSELTSFDAGSGPRLVAQGRVLVANAWTAKFVVWDGASWSAMPGDLLQNAIPGSISDLLAFDDGSGEKLFAAGVFTKVDTLFTNYFARFDGSAWLGGSPGVAGGVYAIESFDDGSGDALYAGGQFLRIDGVDRQRIARWDGANWSSLGSGVNGVVRAFAVFDDGGGDALYAGGSFSSAGGVACNRVARWDGANWSALGTGITGASGNTAVWALATFDDGGGEALYAAGLFDSAGGTTVNGIAKWNGSTWTSLAGGVLGGTVPAVFALEVFDDGGGPALYAGGRFALAGGVAANGIAKWNGTSWSALSTGATTYFGTPGAVFALETFDDGGGDELYVAGNFSQVAGFSASSIARWSGSAWSQLDASFATSVMDLRAFDDGSGEALFAAGTSLYGGAKLARWDGAWSVAASGSSQTVEQGEALCVFDDGSGPALFFGGNFQAMPSDDSNLAKYGCGNTSSPSTFCASSGPSYDGCYVSLTASAQPVTTHANACAITASGVPAQRNGLFFYGVAGQITALWCASGGTSRMCVAAPRSRTGIHNSGGAASTCNGAFNLDWSAYQLAHPGALGQPWSAGASVDVQAWFRDPLACSGIALSQGLRLTYQ